MLLGKWGVMVRIVILGAVLFSVVLYPCFHLFDYLPIYSFIYLYAMPIFSVGFHPLLICFRKLHNIFTKYILFFTPPLLGACYISYLWLNIIERERERERDKERERERKREREREREREVQRAWHEKHYTKTWTKVKIVGVARANQVIHF